jgi:aldehyde dehydrogenase (NAD+)
MGIRALARCSARIRLPGRHLAVNTHYTGSMKDCRQFYINGDWVDPVMKRDFAVVNPANEERIGTISMGGSADVDRAVAAAKNGFDQYSQTTVGERLELIQKIIGLYEARAEEMAKTISEEMGAPLSLSRMAQVPAGLRHFKMMAEVLGGFQFDEVKGTTLMGREPIGVCGLITPWNWPMNQVCCKVAPALAAGCTMVLKPSEIAPLSAYLFAEILDEAGVPAGVFNLVNGDGPTVGMALAAHPDVAMVSFTGSTRAGVSVATAAAPSVKRVTQELGGKSANIILEDADLAASVKEGVQACFRNTGQSCDAPTRLLISRSQMAEAMEFAKKAADKTVVGEPFRDGVHLGPVASQAQFEKVQRLIDIGIREGAKLVTGGLGRPNGLDRGWFVKPTIFADVDNQMTIAREEIFGPVLCMIAYEDEEDALRIANDTPYGLSGYVSSGDIDRARRVAKRIRAGNVHINAARLDFASCFGGYKQSGNGREWGEAGLEEFLELKAILGYAPAPVAAK